MSREDEGFSRRSVLQGAMAAAAASPGGSAGAAPRKARKRLGRISGPVTGGRGWAFGSPFSAQLTEKGYRLDEYLIEGVADAYVPAPGTTVGEDGHWRSTPTRPAAYKSRLMVARPIDAGRFNGQVLVNWQNVTAGVDLGAPSGEELFRKGYAWVGATVQEIAIDGLPTERPGVDAGPPPPGLKAWDPVRYGSLHHPGDDYAFDIYAQIARAARGERAGGPDPMQGLRARRLIAMGGSQSAMFLGAYINMAQAHDRLLDGFLLQVHWGVCWWPGQTTVSMSPLGVPIGAQRVRDDQGVPIMVMNSESEALSMFPEMQPDSRTFRFWDVAGACHSGNLGTEADEIMKRDGVASGDAGGENNYNTLDWSFVQDASLRALSDWIEHGTPPPHFSPIQVKAGPPLQVVRDAGGAALGGVRVPEMEAPVAVQMGLNSANSMDRFRGERRPFDAAQLKRLYPSRAAYLQRYDAATERLLAAGGLLAEDVPRVKARGRVLAAFAPDDTASER